MSDNDIVKAYNDLTPRQQLALFRDLYYNDGYATERGVIANAINDILPEYNRQKAEIERLHKCVKTEEEVRVIAKETIRVGVNIIRAEAIKEFADRLKVYLFIERGGDSTVSCKAIDNLAKEMTRK